MDAPKPNPPLQSFFRLVIMAGSMVVGAMAFKVYGPPPEKMGPIVERFKAVAMALADSAMSSLGGEVDPPPGAVNAPPLIEPAPALTSALAPAFASQSTTAAPPAAPSFRGSSLGGSSFNESATPKAASFRSSAAALPSARRSASVRSALASDPSLASLVTRLEAAGVDHLELAVWGADGRLVRGSCTASTAGSAFRRMLDTIDASPRAALQGLLNRLQVDGAVAQAY